MKKSEVASTRKSVALVFVLLGLVAAFIYLPDRFRSQAGNAPSKSTPNQNEKLEYFDIRTDQKSADILNNFRAERGLSAVEVADQRDAFVRGEESLKRTIPKLKVEYNKELGNPEIIAPDVLQGGALMTAPASGKRSEVLRNFIKDNSELVGLNSNQIDELKVAADYTNPNGELSFVRLEQFVGGIPVFRGEIRAGFNKNNAMFRVVNNLASNADYNSVSPDFGDAGAAVLKAAGYINYQLKDGDLQANAAESTDLKVKFGSGDWATTAEKMYFPIEGGVLRPSWRVLNWEKGDAYYVIVDAQTGTMLYRENITTSQTQAATYNVYANANSLLKVMANPAPIPAPGLLNPATGTQPPLQPRSNVTFIGNEAPYTFNNLGWINDGANSGNGQTDGNNAEAGVDRTTPNGVDATVQGTNRVFNFAYTPGAGPNNSGGDDPLTTAYQNGASTNLFYVTNRYHDETYLLGFTEQARNFQNDNFGRGGAAADRISAEAQDNTVGSSCPTAPCYNNANFSTPADGGRGRMQMYLWNQPTPDRDGDLDAEIIVHELTHGLFGRLHNGTGGTQAGQMNEGNSDFFAHVMLALNDDPIDGVFVTGGYATLLLRGAGFTSNYYYGIRRFPKAVLSFTGGPNNRPHNPMTFKDIDPAQMSLTDGAFAPAFTGSATAVHDGGEIWSSILWEVRAKLVQRLGAVNGNKKVLQLVMDGMKVAPSNPTMIQERNAIISAAQANGNTADLGDLWAGFAVRGLGFSATNPTGNTVTEGNDLPNLFQTPAITVSDAGGDNDGFPEPGETLSISVPLTNNTGNPATGTTAQIVGGGSANYGTINNGQTVTQTLSYTVPANTPCGSTITLTINVNSSLGATSFTRPILIGTPVTTATENFDSVTAPAFPAGWTATVVQNGISFVNSPLNADTAPNAAYAINPTTVGGGSDLTSPSYAITSAGATMSFRNRYDTEAGWDGGALEISIGAGAFQDIITAGGRFIENGYTGALGAGANNPLANRNAWSGNSNGFVTTTVQLPASAAGQSVRFKFRFGADDNTGGSGANPGWYVDTIKVNGDFACSTNPPTSVKSRADYDNDGKTDVSVFRPSEGNWYLNQSTAGFGVVKWGISTDTPVPGDYNGDGKTDLAVFRATADGSQPDFYVLNSGTNTLAGASWGLPGDVPVIRDYDGDDKDDFAVFRPSDNVWYVLKSGGGTAFTTFGQAGDVPVAGDFDGDGKGDLTVYRSGTWISQGSAGGSFNTAFGSAGDILVPADYDGDDKDDLAVFRPSTGQWIYQPSTGGAAVFTSWGAAGDVPVAGDYDGDGKDDPAIYRNGTWWILRSQAGSQVVNFGLATDQAIPRSYVP